MADRSKSFTDFMSVIRGGDYIILDTETTGLDQRAEICQIAIIDSSGQTLLDTLVKPTRPIPPDAQRIHGISDQMVAEAPQWPELQHGIASLIAGTNLIVYNATYDRGMMHKSADAHSLLKTDWKVIAAWHCAMLAYAEYVGDWNDYFGNYRWHRLTEACRQLSLPISNAHNALGDCLMTLAVCRALAGMDGL
jgi:DNA polymerase-3 subunit epsilon